MTLALGVLGRHWLHNLVCHLDLATLIPPRRGGRYDPAAASFFCDHTPCAQPSVAALPPVAARCGSPGYPSAEMLHSKHAANSVFALTPPSPADLMASADQLLSAALAQHRTIHEREITATVEKMIFKLPRQLTE